jgi:hypothetical protein
MSDTPGMDEHANAFGPISMRRLEALAKHAREHDGEAAETFEERIKLTEVWNRNPRAATSLRTVIEALLSGAIEW